MSPTTVPTLDELLSNPELFSSLPPEVKLDLMQGLLAHAQDNLRKLEEYILAQEVWKLEVHNLLNQIGSIHNQYVESVKAGQADALSIVLCKVTNIERALTASPPVPPIPSLSNFVAPHQHQRQLAPVFTYFLLDQERTLVKIGKTNNVKQRIRDLQNANGGELSLLCVQAGDHERTWHERFKHIRERGEWFQYTDQLRVAIERAMDNGAGTDAA